LWYCQALAEIGWQAETFWAFVSKNFHAKSAGLELQSSQKAEFFWMVDISFSLFENAFWVLKAGYESSHAEIVDLAEDAEFEEAYALGLIQRSQQALVSPVARIDQELGWLPGLSERQIGEIRTLLAADHTDELLVAINFLPDLPKANVLAHVSGLPQVDASMLLSLLRCWDDVELGELLESINSDRNISGFPSVDATQISTSVDVLESAHARSAARAIWQLEEPGEVMEQLIEAELATGKANRILGRFVREYDNLSEPKLSQIRSEIDHQIELARQPSPNLNNVTNEIAALLRKWDNVNQPVQLYEQHQGHEEGRSKKIYEAVRSLCLELANDRGEFQYAKRLSEALLHTFPELESAAEVLKGDVATLEDLDEQQRQFSIVEPLVVACEAAKAQLPALKSALQKSRFASARRGILKEIYEAFNAAAKAPGTDDAAFLILRDLALFAHNDRNDPETAFRLMDGLIEFKHANPSKDVLAKLSEERAIFHRNWKIPEFEKQAGDLGAMSKTVDEMLQYAKGNDRAELLQIKATIDRKKAGQKAKWLIYGSIAAAIGFFVISEEMNSSPPRSAPKAALSPAPAQKAEVLPAPVFQLPGMIWNRTGLSGSAPFQIKTSPGADYFIKLVNYQTGADAVGIFVKGGQTIEVQIPPGTYRMRYASGLTWRGEASLFGPGQLTSYSQSASNFEFTRYGGYTVELISQTGGNMSTRSILPSQF